MRKKIRTYLIAGFVIAAVSLCHQILGSPGNGSAMASSSLFSDFASLGAADKKLLKSVSRHPENLLKVSARDVRALLRQPEMIRRESPVTIWQYRSGLCVLDVFFSSTEEDESKISVAHYEIRPRNKDVSQDKARRNCIRSLAYDGKLRMASVTAFFKAR